MQGCFARAFVCRPYNDAILIFSWSRQPGSPFHCSSASSTDPQTRRHLLQPLPGPKCGFEKAFPPSDANNVHFAVQKTSSPGKAIGVLGRHIVEDPEDGYMFRRRFEEGSKVHRNFGGVAWFQA